MLCSPGECDVNVNLPSAEKYLDIITLSFGSFTSTCMPMPGLDGRKSLIFSSKSWVLYFPINKIKQGIDLLNNVEKSIAILQM